MKTVLITGGSTGIGLEISKRFAKNGYRICWVSLLEDEVKGAVNEMAAEYPESQVEYLIQDLSLEEGAQNTYEWVKSLGLDIDVLVNNAGYGTYGMSVDIPMDKEVNMINLNVLNLFKMTRIFLNDMVNRDSGTIINISSSSSFQPVPRMAAYAATKAFVSHYSQGVQQELVEQGKKVNIITICPAGIKDTKFKKSANMDRVNTFESFQSTTKAEVADDVWQAFTTGKTHYKTGSALRNTMWLSKLLPKAILYRVMKYELSEKS